MMPDNVALFATIILLLPMFYFLLAAPAFLLVRLDIPPVARLLPDVGHCRCHRDDSRCRGWSPGFSHWHWLDRGLRCLVAPLVFAADGCPA